mmetsp:Transcript_27060/g.49168  ORF Transcript_27060/g.49168 Transcript_27060/m.49168 type:complete len:213 (+) Transcript_27060:2302-2940(+)
MCKILGNKTILLCLRRLRSIFPLQSCLLLELFFKASESCFQIIKSLLQCLARCTRATPARVNHKVIAVSHPNQLEHYELVRVLRWIHERKHNIARFSIETLNRALDIGFWIDNAQRSGRVHRILKAGPFDLLRRAANVSSCSWWAFLLGLGLFGWSLFRGDFCGGFFICCCSSGNRGGGGLALASAGGWHTDDGGSSVLRMFRYFWMNVDSG